MVAKAITAFRTRANRDNPPNRTPFYPRRKLAINEIYDRLNRELLTPWAFFHSGKLITVTNSEGREIRFNGGLEFEGSPRVIFWDGGFFEPSFRKVITEQIDQTVRDVQNHPEYIEAALDETADLLREFVRKAYDRMAEIDQRLRGKGYPNRIQRRSVEDKTKALGEEIDQHVAAAKRLSKRSPWHSLTAVSKTVWVAIFTGLALVGSIASIYSVGWFGWVDWMLKWLQKLFK